ncbi:DUF5719 family protein [Timonella sp. A28]|uniref:DUF5719 family protein n=1 Tax=Timonella sp. A28 TaxID=3442640 RepID=UPI003EC0DBF2
MSVKTKEQLEKRTQRLSAIARTTSALIAVGAIGYLATTGDTLINDTGNLVTSGTQVNVAAPATQLICPAGTTLNSQDTRTDLGEFNSTQEATRYRNAASLVGGQGNTSFQDLGMPQDTEQQDNNNPKPATSLPKNFGPQNPAAYAHIQGSPNALAMRINGRFISDPESGQYTSAAATSTTQDGDLRGLSGATCATPQSEQWLVGGSTATGTSSKLVIQNPSLTPATVTVTLWGPSGRVELAGSETYLIPAGEQISTLLEGIAPEQRRIAVHVQSRGALVQAYLQYNELDGLTPLGTDYISSSAGPSRAQAITGVYLKQAAVDDPQAATIRLVVPNFDAPQNLAEQSEEDAAEVTDEVVGKARIYLLNAQGHVVMFGAEELDLVSGQVQDINLGGAPEGYYSVLVESDVPLIAGARANKAGTQNPDQPLLGTPSDLAWVGASPVYAHPVDDSGHDNTDAFTTQATIGTVTIPQGLQSTLTVTAFPHAENIAALDSQLDAIPRVYTPVAGAQATTQETEAAAAAREAWKANPTAAVLLYDGNGNKLNEFPLNLAPGQTKTFDLKKFGDVRIVQVNQKEHALFDWSIAASSEDISGSHTVLQPHYNTEEPTQLWVIRSAQAGM